MSTSPTGLNTTPTTYQPARTAGREGAATTDDAPATQGQAQAAQPRVAADAASLSEASGATISQAVKDRAARDTEAALRHFDKDGDQEIDADELDAWIGEKGGDAGKTTEFTNTNRDLKLSKAELQDAYTRQYAAEEARQAAATPADQTPAGGAAKPGEAGTDKAIAEAQARQQQLQQQLAQVTAEAEKQAKLAELEAQNAALEKQIDQVAGGAPKAEETPKTEETPKAAEEAQAEARQAAFRREMAAKAREAYVDIMSGKGSADELGRRAMDITVGDPAAFTPELAQQLDDNGIRAYMDHPMADAHKLDRLPAATRREMIAQLDAGWTSGAEHAMIARLKASLAAKP